MSVWRGYDPNTVQARVKCPIRRKLERAPRCKGKMEMIVAELSGLVLVLAAILWLQREQKRRHHHCRGRRIKSQQVHA